MSPRKTMILSLCASAGCVALATAFAGIGHGRHAFSLAWPAPLPALGLRHLSLPDDDDPSRRQANQWQQLHHPARAGQQDHPSLRRLPDVGTGDGIVQTTGRQETATELRTAPPWGLRSKSRFMHDLKSLWLDQAIARHKGEASEPADHFADLPEKTSRIFSTSRIHSRGLLSLLPRSYGCIRF